MHDPLQILVIDDDPAVFALIERLATSLHASVHALDDPRQALKTWAGSAPDLVVQNDDQPLLRAIRAHPTWQHTAVLVVGEQSQLAGERAFVFDLGADDYLEKPFDLQRLEAKLQSYLRLAAHKRAAEQGRILYAAVLDRLPSGLLVLNAESRILYLNPTGAEIFGVHVEDVVSKLISDVLPRLGDQLSYSADQSELRLTVGDQERVIGYTVAPLDIGGTIVLFRDLATIERLRQTERGAARFFHEIRNPLSAVQATLTLFGGRDVPSDRRARLAAAASREAERVVQLAEEYLARKRTRTRLRGGTALGSLVADIIELNLLGIASPPQITSHCPQDLPLLHCDAYRLRQVVLNLLLNAIEAVRDRSYGTGKIDIFANRDANGVLLAVSDNGPGISAEILPRIFDEHFTTRPHGNGLGLAIIHHIVQEEGGQIRVQTAPERGSTFFVWLPALTGA